MTTPTLSSLISSLTSSEIFQKWLDILDSVGLATETWGPGDPTRETGFAFSQILAEFEDATNGIPAWIGSGFLGIAKGPWLSLLSAQNYNTERVEATFGECTMQMTNTTAANFGTFDPEDVVFEFSLSPAKPTYRNVDAFTLGPVAGPNQQATFTIQADLAGSGSNAQPGDIDFAQSPQFPGVTVANTTACVAQDDESDDSLTGRAQEKFESVSPAGPRGAYDYALRTPKLQPDVNGKFKDDPAYLGGTTNVTRVLVVPESDYGDALIFIAGAGGALAPADVTKGQTTIEKWANPFVITGEVIGASNTVVAVTYELWLYDSIGLTNAQIQANIATALDAAFKGRAIGGDKLVPGTSGFIYADWVKEVIVQAVAPYAFKCTVTAPAADVALPVTYNPLAPATSSAFVGVLGTTTVTAIHQIEG